jgi:predicted alpha-1,6-mannanase (GH76 family)
MVVLLAASCGREVAAGSSPPLAISAIDAEQALAAFNKTFYRGTPSNGYYKQSTDGRYADFWKEAEMIETVEDYFRITRNSAYARLAVALCNGVLARYGANWVHLYSFRLHRVMKNWQRANDDVLWMVIAFTRAYEISGTATFRDVARTNFNLVWARAWSRVFGGGLWWRSAFNRPSKNATTNFPAVIAACEIYRTLGGPAYLRKAETLFSWAAAHLYDPQTGRVFDGVDWSATHGAQLSDVQFTYNQGSFIGAASLLYQITKRRTYYDDALHALEYARQNLTVDGILQNDAVVPNKDPGGFKGIFIRWALEFTQQNGIHTFDAWFRENAAVAWSHRNAAGLVGYDWRQAPPSGILYSWDCSSAVAMLEAVLGRGHA